MAQAYGIFKEAIIRANTVLPEPVRKLLASAVEKEEYAVIKRRLEVLLENAEIAEKEKRPVCQDTGLMNVFLFLPEGAVLPDGFFSTVNRALKDAYKEAGFRFSTVNPPVINRKNPMTNEPAFLKVIDAGAVDTVKVVFMPKGAGSENASFVKMFKPTASFACIIDEISREIAKKAMFSCPPVIAGVCIGGTFDSAPLKAKISLLDTGVLESEAGIEIRERINSSNIGPFGLGGKTTALSVQVAFEPTHIASLPVAVSMSCHALRYSVLEFSLDEWFKLKFGGV